MYEAFPYLSICIFMPLLGALVLTAIRDQEVIDRNAKQVALLTSLFTLFITFLIYSGFDPNDPAFQFEEYITWLPQFGLDYHLGIDGISLFLILLSSLLIPICILASWASIQRNIRLYMALFLILESLLIGTFASLNLALFYIFFEAVLIPMYLLIGIWGGDNRIYASYKFFLCTLAGSVFMLVGVATIYYVTATFDIVQLNERTFASGMQHWLWLAFFASFAVKVPMWPIHTWLPDAHVEAPTAASVILAGVLLKLGAYGFVRFSLPWFPEASHTFAPYVYGLSIVAVIYASAVALVQKDMKKLVAYSSIAHMGYVTVGIFSFNMEAMTGAVVQMLSHGFVSAALFLGVGVLYDRMHTRLISAYGGVVNQMPLYAVFFLLFLLASIGLPFTSGFVGEMLVFIGLYQEHALVASAIAIGVVLGAIYFLKLYARVFYGNVTNKLVYALTDLSLREITCFAPLAVLVFWLGIYPNTFVLPIEKALKPILAKTHPANGSVVGVIDDDHSPSQ